MCVPALFRWLSRKYPRIVEQVVEDEPIRSQVEGGHGEITSDMSQKNPKGTEFDSIAFRAKINQQHSCWLRAAHEANSKQLEKLTVIQESKFLGKELSDDYSSDNKIWDSNTIAPGNPFMKLLTDSLRYLIVHKLNTDPGWKQVRLITNPQSTFKHTPKEFTKQSEFGINMNGKKMLWKGVALLYFIEQERLLDTMRPIEKKLFVEDSNEVIFCQEGHTQYNNIYNIYCKQDTTELVPNRSILLEGVKVEKRVLNSYNREVASYSRNFQPTPTNWGGNQAYSGYNGSLSRGGYGSYGDDNSCNNINQQLGNYSGNTNYRNNYGGGHTTGSGAHRPSYVTWVVIAISEQQIKESVADNWSCSSIHAQISQLRSQLGSMCDNICLVELGAQSINDGFDRNDDEPPLDYLQALEGLKTDLNSSCFKMIESATNLIVEIGCQTAELDEDMNQKLYLLNYLSVDLVKYLDDSKSCLKVTLQICEHIRGNIERVLLEIDTRRTKHKTRKQWRAQFIEIYVEDLKIINNSLSEVFNSLNDLSHNCQAPQMSYQQEEIDGTSLETLFSGLLYHSLKLEMVTKESDRLSKSELPRPYLK
ncbi:XRN 5'-3' exonuclease N-terminus-domain-containing protein [Phakopsora pachyrhizi]|uniref:XRN 5'-3' exonuclease N-terminus-domain-containing protein n=1 Tax=Phakopsora pachyrhizi TaxID=170000 RepID=A0AAV0ANH6_PHAPC|nr:XRN 5'-3' exonuclease N-terminus-domain-containing protein [Phakopsora pachyrhizi]